MNDFKILDSKRYPLHLQNEKNNLPYYRFEHVVSVGKGLREFMGYLDRSTLKVHLCEITGGTVREIEEESLFDDLYDYLKDRDYFLLTNPIYKKFWPQ